MNKKIYVSGGITGRDFQEALKHFADASQMLREQGYEVVNPMELEHNHDQSWENFMRVDLKAMLDCDSIYMLSGWGRSRGAMIEWELAKEIGFNFIYETI